MNDVIYSIFTSRGVFEFLDEGMCNAFATLLYDTLMHGQCVQGVLV